MKPKNLLLLVLAAILYCNGYSQISFEKGYFIDTSGQKTECFIKNSDWKYNPTEFKYKLTENSEKLNATIKSVKEFGIYNNSKYIRCTVKIDRSSDNIDNINSDKNPVFVEEVLFLKVLVEGKSNLYSYEKGSLIRFFYNKDKNPIEQLVNKSYRVSETEVATNDQFRQQLWDSLTCASIEIKKIQKLEYNKSSLKAFFAEYNKCNNSGNISFETKVKRDLFNLSIRPHFNNSSLTIHNSVNNDYGTNFGSKFGLGIGVEAEFILPYKKNKLAVLIDPSYQSFKCEKTTDVTFVSGGKLIHKVVYNSIELPAGLRYYFFLNNNSKIFINASYIFDFSYKSSIEFNRADNSNLMTLEIKSKNNIALGIGYKLRDKYSVQIGLQTNRNILGSYSFWSSGYQTMSLILGYTLF
jgi:hypothetical protein